MEGWISSLYQNIKIPATALLVGSSVTLAVLAPLNAFSTTTVFASLVATAYFVGDTIWISRKKDKLLKKMWETSELLEVKVGDLEGISEDLRTENGELEKNIEKLKFTILKIEESVNTLDKTLCLSNKESERLMKINETLKIEVEKISKLYEKTRKFASLFIKTSEIYKDLTNDLSDTAKNIEHGVGDNVTKLENLVEILTTRTREEFEKLDVNGDGHVTLDEFMAQ